MREAPRDLCHTGKIAYHTATQNDPNTPTTTPHSITTRSLSFNIFAIDSQINSSTPLTSIKFSIEATQFERVAASSS